MMQFMTQTRSYIIAALLAVGLHGLVITLLLVNWRVDAADFTEQTLYYIDATILSDNPYKAKQRNRQAQEAQNRNTLLQRRRQDEAELRRRQAEWEAQQAAALLEEAAPTPPPAVIHEETEQQAPAVTRSPAESAQQLALLVAAEQGMRKAITDDEKVTAYAGQIRKDIVQNWSRPPSARNGMQSVLRVFLIPTGEMVDVMIDESSGNEAFDRSALLAVRKTDRFVVPSDTLMFEKNFREFVLVFRPEDLRL